jgi:D-inositol-3-phosphate glycosyltransferase
MQRARPLRILIVLEYFPPHIGGVETLFDHVTEALAREGHRVTVVTLHLPGTAAREKRHNVRIVRVRTPRWARRGFFTFLAFPVVLRHAFRADIVHAATPNSALAAWLAATIARKPVVHTVHEVFADVITALPGLHSLRTLLFQLFEATVFRLPFAQYLCDSGFTRERLVRLKRIPEERTSIVYPAVDYAFWDASRAHPRPLKRELDLSEETFLALYFGRPGFLKGVEYLIDAAVEVRRRLPRSHFVLLLDRDPSDQYQRLRERITRLGLMDYITVRDPVRRDDLPTYLLAADCVVVPSLSEGFGYAAVEAATLGCPLVTTSGHSVQEVLAGHADFVPPRDADALAAAIIAVRSHPRYEPAPPRYTIEAHVAGVEHAYARALSGAREPLLSGEETSVPGESAIP